MVVKSADHGNDVVVPLFCSFFFLARTIFRESSMKMDVKTNMQHFPVVYLTNRFHVAVGLFSSRSRKTSKCCENISDTLCLWLVCHLLCFYHILMSSVIYY